MSYLVLARKWRPTTFDEVVGQEHVTRTLKNAIERDRVAHALLFTGSRGIGKTSCARILAKALNCDTGPTATPCGVCRACVEITQGSSVDVFEIDGASNNSVEQIREIREAVKFVSTRGKRKMYIIDEVHMLSTAAFNALLKTLEEPPDHVLFVFATTEPHKIPETIQSRCQRYDFKRIPERRIVEALLRIAQAEHIEVEEAALAHIAREAKGGMRDSLSLLDQVIAFSGDTITERRTREVLGVADRATLHALTEAILEGNAQAALELTESLFDFGIDLQKFAGEFVKHLRDLMVIRTCEHPERLVDLAEAEVAALQAQIAHIDPARIHRLFSSLLKGADEIARSAFPKMALEMTLVRLCQQGATLPLAEVLDGLARLEARLDQPLPPGPGGTADGPHAPQRGPDPAGSPSGGAARAGGDHRAQATPTPPPPARPPLPPAPPAPRPQPAAAPSPSTPAGQAAKPAPAEDDAGPAGWAQAMDRHARGVPPPPPPAATLDPVPPPVEGPPVARLAQTIGLSGRPAASDRPRPGPVGGPAPAPAQGPATAAGVTGLQSAGQPGALGPVRAVDSVPWPPPAELGLTPEIVAAAIGGVQPGVGPQPAAGQPATAAPDAAVPSTDASAAPAAALSDLAAALDAAPSPTASAVEPLPGPASDPAPLAEIERIPPGLAPEARFQHLIDQFRQWDGFLAATLEQETRLLAFDDSALALVVPGAVMGPLERGRGALQDALEAAVGHPCALHLEPVEDGDERLQSPSLYDHRQAAIEAANAARREAARHDPGVVRLVDTLGAEIVEVRLHRSDR